MSRPVRERVYSSAIRTCLLHVNVCILKCQLLLTVHGKKSAPSSRDRSVILCVFVICIIQLYKCEERHVNSSHQIQENEDAP